MQIKRLHIYSLYFKSFLFEIIQRNAFNTFDSVSAFLFLWHINPRELFNVTLVEEQ